MIAALVACSSSSHTTPPPISVTLSGAPTSLQTSATAPLTATVANDSTNAGVTWSVTCGSAGACGSFTAVTTTSATYNAPAAVPTGNTVTVTATSMADSTKSSSAVITITASTGAIAVALGSTPASLQVGSGAGITAVVTNDSTPFGVTWSCTPAGSCGTFTPASTLTGVATDFTAPATVPAGGNVIITATSNADPTVSASSSAIQISGPNTTLACTPPATTCNYVFSVSGADTFTFAPYSVAGVFTVTAGLITGGEQDYVDFDVAAHDTINGATSSISNTLDGNLQITLVTCNGTDCTGTDGNVGVGGTETFNGTLACTCTALITEFDGSATGGGTLDLQTSTTAPSGGYAFTIAGVDSAESQLAIGGIINVDTPNGDGSSTISGTGSVFDINDAGTVSQAQGFANTSTVSAPDALGLVTFTLDPSVASGVPEIVLVGYIVDDTRIRLVESLDTFFGTTGGTALAQGTNTGGFGSGIAGVTYVVGVTGFDGFGVTQAAGVLTANGDGTTVTGTINYNDLSGTGTQTPIAVTGTYTVDATGRVTMTGITDGITIPPITLQLYLSGAGTAVAATMDTTDTLSGLAYGQSGSFSAGSLFGNYALVTGGADAINEFPGNETPFFSIGPITADGLGALGTNGAVTFPTGFADINWLTFPNSTLITDQLVTGTFTADPSGVFTGSITGLDVTLGASQTDNFTYYLINNQSSIAIETDTNQLTLGYFDLQQ